MAGQSDGSIVIDTELDATGFKAGSAELHKAIQSLSGKINNLGPTLNKAVGGSESALVSFQQKAAALGEKIAEAEKELERFGNTPIKTKRYASLEYEYHKALERQRTALAQINELEALGVAHSSSRWKTAQYHARQYKEEVQAIEVEMARMRHAGEDHVMGSDTGRYREMATELEAAKNQLAEMVSTGEEVAQVMGRTGSFAGGIKAALHGAKSVLVTIAHGMKTVATHAWSAAKAIGGKLVSALKTAASSMFSLRHSGKEMSKQFSGLVSTAKKFALSMLGARGVYMLLRKAVSAYMAENQELANTLSACWSGIGNILGPIITTLVNLVAQAVAYVTAFLRLFGVMGSSATKAAKKAGGAAAELKRQLASFDELNVLQDNDSGGGGSDDATGKLPEVELPDWVKDITDLFKAGEWGKAFDAILDNLLAAIPKLNTALSKISGIVNSVSKKILDMFTFPGIKEKVQRLGQEIAEALNNFVDSIDWNTLGRALGAGLNTALQFLVNLIYTFDWINLGHKLADAINGFIAEIDWYDVGRLLWAKFKIIIETLAGFLENLDMAQVAHALSDLFKGLFNSMTETVKAIDWKKIVDNIHTFITELDWEGIYNAVAELVGALFTEIPWGDMLHNLWEDLNGLFSWVLDKLRSTDFRALGEAAAQPFNDLFSTIDWETLGATLMESINGLFSLVTGFIAGIDWAEVGRSIGDFILGAVNNIDWAGIGDFLFECINGLLDLLIGFLENFDIADFVQTVTTGIGTIIENIDWLELLKKLGLVIVKLVMQIPEIILGALSGIANLLGSIFEALGLDAIGGFFKGIGDKLKGAYEWFRDNVVNPVVNWFKDLFGIHSPSTVFAEMGGNIIAGLLQGISNAWKSITDFFSGAVEGLKNFLSGAWESIKNTASSVWNSIKDTVSGVWDGIKSGVSSAASTVGSVVSDAWNSIKGYTTEKWDNVKSAVSTAWDSMKSTASTIGSTIVSTASEKWNEVKTNISDKLTAAKDLASTVWDNIKSTASTIGSNIASTVSNKWNEIKNSVTNNLNTAKTNASKTWDKIKSTVSTVTQNIASAVSTKFTDIKTTISTKVEDFKTSIRNGFEAAKESITSKMRSAADTIQNQGWSDVGSNICSGIKSGLETGWTWLKSTVSNIATGLVDSAKNVLGIQSPSKVFRDEVGLNIGYGVGEGITDSESSILRSVSGVSKAVAQEFKANSYSFGGVSMGPVPRALDSFADKITDSFMLLMTRLQAIAEGVSFRIPAAANGFVPYNVAPAGYMGRGDVDNTIKASNEELGSIIIQSVTNATAAIVDAIEANSGTTVNLDIRSLTDGVIAEINRRSRVAGRSPLLG